MTFKEREAIILKSREDGQAVGGSYIDLYPCKLKHGETFVRLRNQEKSRYNLNQKEVLTIEKQNAWYCDYEVRNNDLCWCIYNKAGNMIGTIRLYNIELDGSRCNLGSFIIDKAYAMSGPYALEALLLALDYCFDFLQIHKVLNDDRIDNKNMNSISRRIGFQFIKEFERNDARYNLYELTKATYKRAVMEKLLDKWIALDQ